MSNPLDVNGVGALHMLEPIWVWLYDYGPATHPEGWKHDASGVKAYPQAHTYAFRSESEARAHPAAMGWKKDHPYVLQKSYLNGRAPLASSHTAVEPVGELVERLRNIVTEFDNEVADMMSNDGGERADLWVDVDVPIGIVRQADSALTAQAAALVAAEKRIAELEAGLDAAEAYNEEHGGPADTLHHGRSVLDRARRLTHQEKNNG